MEVITLNKKFLKIFGMCLDDEYATSRERTISKCVNWTMLCISICTVGVSCQYVISQFSDTESILFAVMQIAANTASGGGYFSLFKKKYQVSKFLKRIENLVKLRMYLPFIFKLIKLNEKSCWSKRQLKSIGIRANPDSQALYEQAEANSTFVAKWPLIVFIANYDFVLIFATTYTVIFEMIPARSDPANWYAMYKMRWENILFLQPKLKK